MLRLATSVKVALIGKEASRVVVSHDPTSREPYSTHIEVCPEDRGSYLIWGHYFETVGEALEDFRLRFETDYRRQLEQAPPGFEVEDLAAL